MAYNKGLNPVTGRGGQTIDALKTRSAGYDAYIKGVSNNTGAIEKPFRKIVVTADGTGNTLTANIPDGTREVYCQLEVEAGTKASNGQISIGSNVLMASVSNVVITNEKHVWASRIASFTDGEKTYRYFEGAGSQSIPSVVNATAQGAIRYVDVDEIGTIKFTLTAIGVKYTEGDTLTIFYR